MRDIRAERAAARDVISRSRGHRAARRHDGCPSGRPSDHRRMQKSAHRGSCMKEQKSLDAISLEIFRNALESIVDECFVALMKSAYSSNIKERRDHSVALFDAGGRLVAQAKDSLPIHLSSLGGLIDALIS